MPNMDQWVPKAYVVAKERKTERDTYSHTKAKRCIGQSK